MLPSFAHSHNHYESEANLPTAAHATTQAHGFLAHKWGGPSPRESHLRVEYRVSLEWSKWDGEQEEEKEKEEEGGEFDTLQNAEEREKLEKRRHVLR